MSSHEAPSVTVWELALDTGQPLEVVIYQAVAYNAWEPGGRISGQWAMSLRSVLHGSNPWQRTGTGPASVATDGEAPGTKVTIANFSTSVLMQLGKPVPVTDSNLAKRLSAVSLGEISDDQFIAYPEEAATWTQLASGQLDLDDLESSR